MVLAARLELRQRQALVITPQLQQAIKLLQLSSLELLAYLEKEIEQNPLLCTGEADGGDAGGPGDGPDAMAEAPLAAHDLPDLESVKGDEARLLNGDAREAESPGDFQEEPRGYDEAGEWKLADRQHRGETGEGFDIALLAAPPASLRDYLWEQASLLFRDDQERFVARYLIDLIEPDGYFRADLNDVHRDLGLAEADLAVIFRRLQTCHPAGVFARNLGECLALQLQEKNRLDPCMERLLARLDLLAARDFAKLRRLCEVSGEDLEEMIAEVKALDPRPGLAFVSHDAPALIPDVLVRRKRGGGWHIELNPETSLGMRVDRAYYNTLKARIRTPGDRDYLAERLSAANWLAKSLEQRSATIIKVATAIVEAQAAFFEKGVRHLKPLNLRQVAAKIGMHESTVSRVTSNKTMATPRGILDMKYLFTSSIPSAGPSRQAHSSEAVRDRIRELIGNERPGQILSDDRIVSLLQSNGIDIARRTVAKYREAMRIPSSSLRRRVKRDLSQGELR